MTICNRHTGLSRVLLSGADLTIVDPVGDTALHYAARRGDPEILQSMLEHGACVDARSTPRLCTPLMSAVMKAHRNENGLNSQLTIEKLIAANSDLNAVDENGITVLMMAVGVLAELWDSDVVPNCETRRVITSVSISLIEAGQTFCLH